MPNEPGADAFRQLEVLAASSASWVHRARRLADNTPVIIKGLHFDTATAMDVARLRYEHKILLHLLESKSHPGVARPLALLGSEADTRLILEDVGGYALSVLMGERKISLSVPDALFIAEQVLLTLQHVHQKQVVHRDINPSNIIYNTKTRQVQIVDFGIASLLEREAQQTTSLRTLEGTLAYIAPEQTGRMNCFTDYRADFYSLGATLYNLLSGSPPFGQGEIDDMVYAVLAKAPSPLADLVPQVPPMVVTVVQRLMEKAPERRYQSAHGVLVDLRRCREAIENHGSIETFVLGQHERPERFELPQRLYGRQAELQMLHAAWSRAAARGREMLFLAGPSGIGKTALAADLQQDMLRHKAIFVAGKHDQLSRTLPFSAFSQAIAAFVRMVLSEPEEELEVWRRRLRSAVGNVGRALTDIAPSVVLLLGQQKAIAVLPAQESESRLLMLLQRFVEALAEKRPLVLFLDDLQWADSGTLKLLRAIFSSNTPTAGLMVIGAYRDNEVAAEHPLALCIQNLERAVGEITHVTLRPLRQEDTEIFLTDALGASSDFSAQALARLVNEKTGGNPFFLREFLRHLHSQKLLNFDLEAQSWRWDLSAIRAAAVTDNIIELMTTKLNDYPPRTRELLSVAACLGNEFHLDDLCALHNFLRSDIVESLLVPLTAGMLMPVGLDHRYAVDTIEDVVYRFAHDRVQQAAFELLDAASARRWHGHIGRQLQSKLTSTHDDRLFAALSHLNAAAQDIASESERLDLATLNVRGAREAKRSGVYQLAIDYLQVAFELLGDDRWTTQPALTREAELEMADSLFSMGRAADAASHLDHVDAHSRTNLERSEADGRRINVLTAMGQWTEALNLGIKSLRTLGINIPRAPNMLQMGLELLAAKIDLRKHDVDALHTLPRVQERRIILAIEIISRVALAAFYENEKLVAVGCLRALRLILRYGTSPYAGSDFSKMVVLSVALNDYAGAKRYSRLVTLFNDANPDALERTAAQFLKVIFIDWVDEGPEVLAESLRQTYLLSQETGDPLYGAWAVVTIAVASLTASLSQGEKDSLAYADFVASRTEPVQLVCWREVRQIVRLLRGQTAGPHDWNSEDYVSDASWQEIVEIGVPAICFCAPLRMIGAWVHGDFKEQQALLDIDAEINILGRALEYFGVLYSFFGALVCMSLQRTHGKLPKRRRGLLRRMLEKLRTASDAGIVHYNGLFLLLQAEAASLHDRPEHAMTLYSRANEAMMTSGYTAFRAVGLECAGRFYLREKLLVPAFQNLQQARDLYHRWGATKKVDDLDAEVALLLVGSRSIPRANNRHTTGRPATVSSVRRLSTTASSADDSLELPALIAMSQIFTSETSLDALARATVDNLCKISGASRAAILQIRGDSLVQLCDSSGDVQALPDPIIQYVRRTKELLLLAAPEAIAKFVRDDSTGPTQPQSVLCLPAQHQGVLEAIIYLDNTVATNVFTSQRTALVKVLCAQIAISLANRQMVYQLEKEVTERSQRLQEDAERLHRLETEKLENQMAGGFAHEMRNALSGASYGMQLLIAMPGHPIENFEPVVDSIAIAVSQLQTQPSPNIFETMQDHIVMLRESLARVGEGIDRGIGLTTRILEYAQAAEIVAGHEEADVSGVLRSVLDDFAPQLSQQSIRVRHDGPQAAPAYIREAHVRTILHHLIANAHDALEETQGAGTTRDLSVAVRHQGGHITVSVEDNGVGMSEDARKRVFQPFFSTKGSKGMGLGLGLSRKLADAYGGKLEFESEPQHGTTFRVVLPAVRRS